MLGRLIVACGVLASTAASANDSIRELGTGGLIVSRSDALRLQSERLMISPDRVTGDYLFRNDTDEDIEATVAFPMPDIDGMVYDPPQIPDNGSDNFLDFEVKVDGRAVKPQLEQRAFAVGIDVTDLLMREHVPVNPFAPRVSAALQALPVATATDWISRGLIFMDSRNDGSGWNDVRTPRWSLKSTYWWRSSFPAHKEVKIWHRYKPSVGETVGVSFYSAFHKRFNDDSGTYSAYKKRYCMDEHFEQAILKAAKESEDVGPMLSEQHIEYVQPTSRDWAPSTIEDFTLIIDKGYSNNLVSFCGENVRRTGPTTFEMTAQQYYPEENISILILEPVAFVGIEGDVPIVAPAHSFLERLIWIFRVAFRSRDPGASTIDFNQAP
jgi:hypothetical protein